MERLLEIYSKEMDEIAPKVLAFFKEYEANPMTNGLSAELDTIIDLLRVRIYKEENVFIKQYENIIGQTDNKNKML